MNFCVLLFKLNGITLGLDVEQVAEILLEGGGNSDTITYKGADIPLLSLIHPTQGNEVIIVRSSQGYLGLKVGSTMEVVSLFPRYQIYPLPPLIRSKIPWLWGLAEIGEEMALLIDVEQIEGSSSN